MHSNYVESKGCHFLFYGVIRKKVNCCVCNGWFPVYSICTSSLVCLHVIVRSKKATELCFMLLCILFI